MSNFAACLKIILESEGGFVDLAADPGGATNLGITLATLSSWLGRTATIAEVEALTPDAVAPIYLADYWRPAHCQDWPPGVDLMVFDDAVQSGVGGAVRRLQRAVAVQADGRVGPVTEAAVAHSQPRHTIGALAVFREEHYRSLPTFSRFGRGWLSRLDRTEADALVMAGVKL